jgi:hypothetical protein
MLLSNATALQITLEKGDAYALTQLFTKALSGNLTGLLLSNLGALRVSPPRTERIN